MRTIALFAGGTGGHLFPAMALAGELNRRGHEVHLVTDERVQAHGGQFPARKIHVVPSATPSIRNPLKLARAGLVIGHGVLKARSVLKRVRPHVVVAFGGYPVVPPFLAARMLGIPGVLHEQNAVMGRANRALARFADAIALSSEPTRFADPFAEKTVLTGNPVRDTVRELRQSISYQPPAHQGWLNLVITGGSQGARFFSDAVPAAVALLPDGLRKRLRILQQCRPEDLERVARAYKELRVDAELSTFVEDLPARIMGAHLVICRSGASTVTELKVLGVPAIMVPLPGSLDADQKMNGLALSEAGAGWLMEQDKLSPHLLAKRLEELLGAPEQLAFAAQAARKQGRPDAVAALADLAIKVADASPNQGEN